MYDEVLANDHQDLVMFKGRTEDVEGEILKVDNTLDGVDDTEKVNGTTGEVLADHGGECAVMQTKVLMRTWKEEGSCPGRTERTG